MFSSDDIDKLTKVLAQLGVNQKQPEYDNNNPKHKKNYKKHKSDSRDNHSKNSTRTNSGPCLTPAQILIIAGFLSGVLDVNSILVDKEQVVQIVLTGSLKRRTELDRIMQQIGQMPFEDVMKSILNNI